VHTLLSGGVGGFSLDDENKDGSGQTRDASATGRDTGDGAGLGGPVIFALAYRGSID
jgi:hypothetical protein